MFQRHKKTTTKKEWDEWLNGRYGKYSDSRIGKAIRKTFMRYYTSKSFTEQDIQDLNEEIRTKVGRGTSPATTPKGSKGSKGFNKH